MSTKKISYSIIICLLLCNWLGAQIEKIEPPFWWSDMTNPELQIMLYGSDIASHDVIIEGFQITNIVKTENSNYLFVTINTRDIEPGYVDIKLIKHGIVTSTTKYEFKERIKDSRWRQGFNSSDLVYLIMPDRFANGDESNDNREDMIEVTNRSFNGGRHGGDIRGVINNLEYIHELGATAIWSTPLLEDNYHRYSYHHYAQSDVYRIDPRFGTNEEYIELSRALHAKEMKLIMDYVTNHWSIVHWMVKDLPCYDWIHQFPGYANTNHRMTTQFDPNASRRDKRYSEDGWFVPTMPDLNQRNPLVLNYLIQNAIWWIEYAELDGFRVDTYSYNDKDAIARWTKAIMDEYPNFNIVGEAWYHNQAQISYWQKDSPIGSIQAYNSYCPSVMDFTLHDALMAVFSESDSIWGKGLVKIYDNLANDFLYADVDNIMIFLENHDTPRFNELYPKLSTYKLAITLLATLRGIPQIYYGSEIGMKGKKDVGDGDIRRDFPGGWKEDTNNAFTNSGRNKEQNAYYDFARKVFNWRKNKPVIHKGQTMQFAPKQDVYVYFRYNDEEQVMVVINNSVEDRVLNLSRFNERLKGNNAAIDILSGEKFLLLNELKIKARTSLILEF